MKKISLFIVFVLTINFVQTQKNTVIYDEDSAKISSYNRITTLTDNSQFGYVEVSSFETQVSRITNFYNRFFSFKGINSPIFQLKRSDTSIYFVTNSEQNDLRSELTILNPSFIGIKDTAISFASTAYFFSISQNLFDIPRIADVTIITINESFFDEFIYDPNFSLLTKTSLKDLIEPALKHEFQVETQDVKVRNIYNDV